MAVWWEIFCRYVWYHLRYSRCIFMCFFGRLGNKNYVHLEPSEKCSKRISAKRWIQTKEELSSLNVSRGIRSQSVMCWGYFWSNTERKFWWKWKRSLSAYAWSQFSQSRCLCSCPRAFSDLPHICRLDGGGLFTWWCQVLNHAISCFFQMKYMVV